MKYNIIDRLERAAVDLLACCRDDLETAYAEALIDQIAEVRALFSAALGRRRAEETDAAQQRQAGGGVPRSGAQWPAMKKNLDAAAPREPDPPTGEAHT